MLNKSIRMCIIKPGLSIVFFLMMFEALSQPGDTLQFSSFHKSNYTIQYPSGWTTDTSRMMNTDLIIFSPAEDGKDGFRENVNLMVQDLAGKNIDLEKYTQISEQQITEMIEDGKIIESKTIRATTGDFHRIEYTMRQGQRDLHFVQHYLIRNETAYVLTFTCEASRFGLYKAASEKILNSFQFRN